MGASCGNVPLKSNANRFLVQRAISIAFHWLRVAIQAGKNCNYNLCFRNCKNTASHSWLPNEPSLYRDLVEKWTAVCLHFHEESGQLDTKGLKLSFAMFEDTVKI